MGTTRAEAGGLLLLGTGGAGPGAEKGARLPERGERERCRAQRERGDVPLRGAGFRFGRGGKPRLESSCARIFERKRGAASGLAGGTSAPHTSMSIATAARAACTRAASATACSPAAPAHPSHSARSAPASAPGPSAPVAMHVTCTRAPARGSARSPSSAPRSASACACCPACANSTARRTAPARRGAPAPQQSLADGTARGRAGCGRAGTPGLGRRDRQRQRDVVRAQQLRPAPERAELRRAHSRTAHGGAAARQAPSERLRPLREGAGAAMAKIREEATAAQLQMMCG
jgi:hypothetical protein